MLDVNAFRALCQLVTEEQDESKLEVLKERMKLLLMEARTKVPAPEILVNCPRQ
jgi:septum formation topological specificity factor MinE